MTYRKLSLTDCQVTTIPSGGGIRRITTPLPLLGLAPLVFNLSEYGVHVRCGEVAGEPSRQYGFRPKLAGFIQLPDLARVFRFEQLRRRAPECRTHVIDVTLQHGERVVVAGRVDGLRQIDDDRPGAVQQDVELGKVAMDQAGTEHSHDLDDHEGMPLARLGSGDLHV